MLNLLVFTKPNQKMIILWIRTR